MSSSELTLSDVAEKAGVSPATVSRVLSGGYPVKKSTQARVLRAVKELNYYPNLHARSLATGSSRTIGVLISNLHNPFFSDVLYSIESEALERGYEVVVENTRHDMDLFRASLRQMLGIRVAGIAAMTSDLDESVLQEMAASGVPTVCYDVGKPSETITTIRFDYRKGMQMLIDLLYSLGHRRMAYIGAPLRLGPTEERRATFLAATEVLSVESRVVVPHSDGFRGGREAIQLILQENFQPTAVLCVNDWIAIGAIRELRTSGISVPNQISVTGFDNIELAEFSVPSLTTIHIPRDTIGKTVVDSLLQDRQHAPNGRDVRLHPELIVRESTTAAPGR